MPESPTACIWCGSHDPAAVPEHIIPECLGCPDKAVLRASEVCTSCNSRISQRDAALCDGFDLLRLTYGQRGKKGQPPAITGRPNVRTLRKGGENIVQVNLGPQDQLLADGFRLKPPTKLIGSVQGTFGSDGNIGRATLSAHLFYQRDFVRGVYKVALEALALFEGVGEARLEVYDQVREFVLNGNSAPRRCLVGLRPGMVGSKTFSNALEPPRHYDDGRPGCVVPIRLMDIVFLADCTPDEQFIEHTIWSRQFVPAAYEWKVLPWELDPATRR